MGNNFPERPPHPSRLDQIDIKSLDPRLVLDKSTQRWLFEHNDKEYEFDYAKNEWISILKRSHDDIEKEEEDKDEDKNREDIKRQRKEEMSKIKSEINQLKQQQYQKKRKNHSIYITNLPSTLTIQDIEKSFGTFGKIQFDKEGKPKIKMYRDEKGNFKGDALVIYTLLDSAYLAIEMMDNSLFNGQTIRVEHARFDDKPLDKKKSEQSHFPVVIIENMFRNEELTSDKYLKTDIIEDINEECVKIGIPKVLDIQFESEKGNVTVKFDTLEHAKICIQKFNNRYYDGLQLNVKLKTN